MKVIRTGPGFSVVRLEQHPRKNLRPKGSSKTPAPVVNKALLAELAAYSLLAAQTEMPPFTPSDHAVGTTPPHLVKKAISNRGRSLVTPADYDDTTLLSYLTTLAPLALSPEAASRYPAALSPRLVPLLLGGMPMLKLEALTERVLDLLGFTPDEVDPTLNHALHLVGFGPGQRHMHFDSFNPPQLYPALGEEPEHYLSRINDPKVEPQIPALSPKAISIGHTQHCLSQVIGPFAEALPYIDAYPIALYRKVLRQKWAVMAGTITLFHEASGHIPEASRINIGLTPRQWLDDTQVSSAAFSEAVRMVFERPWVDLDLVGSPKEDVPRVMARLLIRHLCRGVRGAFTTPRRMSARALVGISLLTGIPTAKFVRFAVEDLKRRGETFLTGDTVREAVALVDESEQVFHLASSAWMQEMNALAAQLEASEHPTRAYLAYRLRMGSKPLFSSGGAYQIVAFKGRDEDEPVYKPRLDPKLVGLREEM